MIDISKRISRLVLKNLNGSLSQSESIELEAWLASAGENRIWLEQWTKNKSSLTRMLIARAKEEKNNKPDWEKFAEKFFFDNIPTVDNHAGKVISLGRRMAVAAAILILLSAGTYYWFVKGRSTPGSHEQMAIRNDVVAPIGNNTILTLGDGTRIVLDSMSVGKLATQGKTSINKTSNGQITYTALNGKPAPEILMNTLSTSYGGASRVVLPDGSSVWLNSLSSLRFPNIFTGQSREVELTGEGYFEIAPNKSMPFHLRVNGTDVEVLGTHFEVMAYFNEASQKITLLEGAVRVKAGKSTSLLLPGQQAKVGAAIQVVKDADTDEVMAWVGGKFKFRSANIEDIMRQLERWYNIDVAYAGKPTIQLSGSISKSKNLSEVLELFKLSGVNYSIEGRRVTIKP